MLKDSSDPFISFIIYTDGLHPCTTKTSVVQSVRGGMQTLQTQVTGL